MTAALLILSAFTTGQQAPVCQLTYVLPDGRQEIALRLMTDGSAISELRGDVFTTSLGQRTVEKLRDRFARYRVCELNQPQFDQRLAEAARDAGLQLPIPFADSCSVSIPGGSLTCCGSAVLATRLPGEQAVCEFEQLRRDLEQLRAIVLLGGASEMAAFLRAGETAYGKQVPMSSVVFVDRFDGEQTIHFRPDGDLGPLLIVSATPDRGPTARIVDTSRP